jgi:hypothetical protein
MCANFGEKFGVFSSTSSFVISFLQKLVVVSAKNANFIA